MIVVKGSETNFFFL
jgi:chromosome segregation ATPase